MNDMPLYQWPIAAKVGRVVPKTKFYEHGRISAAIRDRFVTDVQRITWAYKLADATIHLRGDASVPEIQVFVIQVKAADVGDDVLAAIDRSVPFPTILEIHRPLDTQGLVRMTAAHKELGGTRPRLSDYFTTDWQPADSDRRPMPPALDLPGLYAALIRPILPIETQPGERLADTTARIAQVRKVEREIAALERQLRTEPQFNRKVTIRRELQEREAARGVLAGTATLNAEDAPWRS